MASEFPLAVHINVQFQRSIQLEIDLPRSDALSAYVCQPSPRNALTTVARHILDTQQRAFTWTGPYGGGKSSLALALGQLAGGTPAIKKISKQALKIENDDEIWKVFGSKKPWLVLPVVGRRQAAEEVIGQAIDKYSPQRGPKKMRGAHRDVISELVRRADSDEYGGVLLILDELGKLFESAAAAGEDIFFFQELAEAASRAEGKLVIIGVLHQAFDQYAARSGRTAQAEWAKVQGRFVDIPMIAGTDEMIELIGGALKTDVSHPGSRTTAQKIAQSIQQRRPSSSKTLASSLDKCWPLHPVTAALLGPTSRRRFGQNERSVFGFLSSAEPLGFREFLLGQSKKSIGYYTPARFWDYLRINFEPAILASADGHRWAISAEAVERVEAIFSEPHVSLVKTVGLIELFRNGSGIAASNDVLVQCIDGSTSKQIEAALADLAKASVLIYRRHLEAWGVFAGSDFDIDAAVDKAKQQRGGSTLDQLKALAVLPPITARKHYSETGTLRWFERVIVTPESLSSLQSTTQTSSCTGKFLLILPNADTTEEEAKKLARDLSKKNLASLDVFGIPKGHYRLAEFAAELAALEYVSESTLSLQGDNVARREINARLQQLRSDLEGALRDAFSNACWYFLGSKFEPKVDEGLSPIASKICDQVFDQAPHVFSELINRDTLSSSAAKAQRMLMHRMVEFASRPDLDYLGFPADAGLYFTAVASLGLHRSSKGQAKFTAPEVLKSYPNAQTLIPLWKRIQELLQQSNEHISLAQIYAVARSAPFGVKRGLLPIIMLSFLLAHRSEIALYVEDMFCPDLTDANVDEWLQDAERITWKWVHMDATAKKLLSKLSAQLEEMINQPVAADPLDSARALVSLMVSLPSWTQRTTRLSHRTREARTLLLRASDPVKVIFVDMPEVLETKRNVDELVRRVGQVVKELTSAYPDALHSIGTRMLEAIDHSGHLRNLQARAKIVQGITGDFKLDAFAGRLQSFSGSDADIEGLVSLASSRPPKEFTDHDLDHAMLQLAQWAFEFRRVEALATVQGRPSNRRALAVVFGGKHTVSATVDVSEDDAGMIQQLADGLFDRVKSGSVKRDVLLAALADAGVRVMEIKDGGSNHG